MATYQVLGRTEFLATETPRIYYKGLATPVGIIGCQLVSPSGAIGPNRAMTQVGVSQFWYLDVSDTYVQGAWCVICADVGDSTVSEAASVIQWGVTNTATVAANDARTQATLARQIVGNEMVPNSTTAPTLVYLKDDSGNPFMSRTIANGDNTTVNPQQVLKLGKYT